MFPFNKDSLSIGSLPLTVALTSAHVPIDVPFRPFCLPESPPVTLPFPKLVVCFCSVLFRSFLLVAVIEVLYFFLRVSVTPTLVWVCFGEIFFCPIPVVSSCHGNMLPLESCLGGMPAGTTALLISMTFIRLSESAESRLRLTGTDLFLIS